jgi:hypothetical protein
VNPDEVHWVTELNGKHSDDIGVVCGNGWSMNFYDPAVMKAAGCVLLGCNTFYEKVPYVDYLVFQDANVIPKCLQWPGRKIMDYRKIQHRGYYQKYDISNVYFYNGGRYGRNDKTMENGNSGSLALQLAHMLGFKTILLAGCDCEFIECKDEDVQFHSNIFKDRQVEKTMKREMNRRHRRKCLEQVTVNGEIKLTNNILKKFAHKFESLYRRFREDANIFKLGKWGIVDVPSVDFEEFWSDEHPDKKT